MQKEPLKGNIGEWSELYALGYLLINAGAYAADENQNAIRFYERFGFVREGDIFWTSKTDGIIPGGVYKLKLDANKNIVNICI